MNKEIIYLNTAKAVFPKRENGKWDIEELEITRPPTLCRVTINKTITIDDVYVWCREGENICLYKGYHIVKSGWHCGDMDNCWPIFIGDGLVLEFNLTPKEIPFL